MLIYCTMGSIQEGETLSTLLIRVVIIEESADNRWAGTLSPLSEEKHPRGLRHPISYCSPWGCVRASKLKSYPRVT